MITKKRAFSRHRYKFAITLSILIHLIFVATVEAAVLLGRVFESPSHGPLVTLQPLRSSFKRKENKVVSEAKFQARVKHEVQGKFKSKSGKAEPIKNKSVAKNQAPHLERTLQRFEHSQAKIDRRIKNFEENLIDLASHQKEIISREPVTFNVFDLEKVPAQAQENLLPSYLKRMRTRIAKFWAASVEPLGVDSGVAVVQYRILASGSIAALKTRSIQGSEIFEEACRAAVEKASPFEPLPFRFSPSVENQYLTVALTFYFRKTKPKK